MIKKLKKKNGETLIEALVSLLIAILAMGLVNSASMAATNMNKNTRDMDQAFADEVQIAELQPSTATITTGKIIIDFQIEGVDNFVEDVKIYSKDSGSRFASYEKYVDVE